MITIKQSKTADTRSYDFTKVTKEQLLLSSHPHVGDVKKARDFFKYLIDKSVGIHDHDKFSDIDGFHHDFVDGFKKTTWWDKHRHVNRHHLLAADGVPDDVNLIDVLDMIADCTMAGMGRTGTVFPLDIKPDILIKAFNNTADLLKRQIHVEKEEPWKTDE